MKTQEEIEQLAEQYVWGGVYLTEQEKQQTEIAYMSGYTQCQEDMVKESILFANFLKADFEMEDSESNEDIVWRLCGTRQTYTTDEIYDEFIKSRSLINSLNKQD